MSICTVRIAPSLLFLGVAACRTVPRGPVEVSAPPVVAAVVVQTNQSARFQTLGPVAAGPRGVSAGDGASSTITLRLEPGVSHQTIYGFGASFTESSAWALATLPEATRRQVMHDLFDPRTGAGFSMARTHIGSSDYSNGHYGYIDAYAGSDDATMATFSIAPDQRGFTGDENDQVRGVPLQTPEYDMVPMIQEALAIQPQLKIVASPWSAPRWMKSNGSYVNGTLKPEYQRLWARYLSAYLSAYSEQGISIWALTPQNEPLHYHDARWDSMGWEARAMRDFIKGHLGPQLEADGLITPDDWAGSPVRILAFDHNKQDMGAYLDTVYKDPAAARFVWGSAFHWYPSSKLAEHGYHAAALDDMVERYPNKALLHTESSIDIQAAKPIDQYFGRSTDWMGEFVPFETYANDIISNLNHGAQGYIEWCMVLSTEGQPNPYDNFNSAPILIDPRSGEVVKTPLYFILRHFSQFIRPEAVRIGVTASHPPDGLVYVAARNPDGSAVVVLFNGSDGAHALDVVHNDHEFAVEIAPQSLQTVVIPAGAGVP